MSVWNWPWRSQYETQSASQHRTGCPRRQPPPDPRIESINARWAEFEADNDEGRRKLFVKTLDEPELMDDELAFQMLCHLHDSAVESGERDRSEELVEQLRERLRERLPTVYATSRKYYLQWSLVNALATRQPERVPALARQMAETADDDVDQYARVVDLLAYHGQLAALTEASRIAWPLIKQSSEILWGQDDFARWGADCVLLERLERTRELDGHDPELIAQMRFFFDDLQPELFAEYMAHLSGQAKRAWPLSDFQQPPRRRNKTRKPNSDDEESHNKQPTLVVDQKALASLADEFVDYARHQEGVPYTKAALARENITRYILERQSGDLEPRESLMKAMLNPQRNLKPKPKPRVPDHPLCPDHDTLDRYFANLLHFMNPQQARWKRTRTTGERTRTTGD